MTKREIEVFVKKMNHEIAEIVTIGYGIELSAAKANLKEILDQLYGEELEEEYLANKK